MIFEGKVAGSGFTHVPGGDEYKNRSALSYHYYCDSFTPKPIDKPFYKRLICDDAVGPLVFEAVDLDHEKNGGASMLTEFGDCFPVNSTKANEECNFVMDLADKRMDSYIDWTDAG